MINGQSINNDLITYEKFEKSQQVKEMIIQLVVCWTITISKNIIR